MVCSVWAKVARPASTLASAPRTAPEVWPKSAIRWLSVTDTRSDGMMPVPRLPSVSCPLR